MTFFVLLSGLMIFQNAGETPVGYEPALYRQAAELSKQIIILDGHVDAPMKMTDNAYDISVDTKSKGNFDFEKAKRGGYDAPFMSIYIESGLQLKPGESKKRADMLIDLVDSAVKNNPNRFAKALTPTDVRENFKRGLISLPMGMENGSALEDDLSNVDYFFKRGIRYITLTHSKKNKIGDSSYDTDKSWNGLSPFGYRVIGEMNRLGIMIDLSHVSDSVFLQVLRYSKVPVICSHSSLRVFTPGFERNVSDDMLKLLAKKGGVIQINFGSSFLTEDANKYREKRTKYINEFKEKYNLNSNSDPKVKAETEKYNSKNSYPFATIDDVVRHIDYAVKLVGADYVGLGSDFDGVGDSLPVDLKSVDDMPKLIYKLMKKGYTASDIEKIMSGNVLRVWQQVTDYANNNGGK